MKFRHLKQTALILLFCSCVALQETRNRDFLKEVLNPARDTLLIRTLHSELSYRGEDYYGELQRVVEMLRERRDTLFYKPSFEKIVVENPNVFRNEKVYSVLFLHISYSGEKHFSNDYMVVQTGENYYVFELKYNFQIRKPYYRIAVVDSGFYDLIHSIFSRDFEQTYLGLPGRIFIRGYFRDSNPLAKLVLLDSVGHNIRSRISDYLNQKFTTPD